ncbi:MAG: UDP-N-acetylmuramoyl-L-alanine--D-glutamate ligase [Bacteroidota bacterium]|nr:UDP-N-acetylmuramoyl-L-alanine--D-glutamate ligase [Bacteroidota bacterium]
MKPKEFIVILGAGESGTGAAVLAKKKGFEVFVSDKGIIQEKYKKVLLHNEIGFEEEDHNESLILKAAKVVKSPGIPDEVAIVKKLKQKGIPVISEIEFAFAYTDAKLICITGSNGKTTTSLLMHHILQKAGLKAGLAGNVGRSFAWQVAEEDCDIYVLEISSFQLDGMFRFKADIAVLLNITPDHLDRYNYDFQSYVDSKFRIINNQQPDDAFIYWQDDPVILDELQKRNLKMRMYPFSVKAPVNKEGAFVKENKMIVNINSTELSMTLEELALQGKHNLFNSMAAGIAARILDIRKNIIKESLSDFQNIEHRLEYVATVHGVEFINDSKATNINSSWYALESMNKKVVWIAGGIDKGNDYSLIRDLVREKVKAIVCLGTNNENIHNAFGGVVEKIVDTQSASEAVNAAFNLSIHGETILLSPACASFDLFDNYEDRGRQFKEAVKSL